MHPMHEWHKWTIELLQNVHHKAKDPGLTGASVSCNRYVHHPRKRYKQAQVLSTRCVPRLQQASKGPKRRCSRLSDRACFVQRTAQQILALPTLLASAMSHQPEGCCTCLCVTGGKQRSGRVSHITRSASAARTVGPARYTAYCRHLTDASGSIAPTICMCGHKPTTTGCLSQDS